MGGIHRASGSNSLADGGEEEAIAQQTSLYSERCCRLKYNIADVTIGSNRVPPKFSPPLQLMGL